MKISILHPFTAEAVGLGEKDLIKMHSQPHFQALKYLAQKKSYTCYLDYFTSKRRYCERIQDGIIYRFFPVNFKFNGDHRKWRKQESTKCLKYYKRETPEVTIINMSGHSSPFSFEISEVIRKNKKEYIAMLGGQHYSDNKRNRDYYKNAHHILVHTYSQKKIMQKMDLFKETDIRVFPLGVDCTIFKPDFKKSESPNLLYVGRIMELKRIHLALEALKKLVETGFPKAHLNIIGPVSSNIYFDHLKELVLKFQIQKNVSFLGEMEQLDLVNHYQSADLLMLPSKSESFGMVIVEAMACGTPVAAIYSSGGPEDIIEHGKDGILASPEDYGEAVLKFFNEKESASRMSKRARERVEENYSINNSYKTMEESVYSAIQAVTQHPI